MLRLTYQRNQNMPGSVDIATRNDYSHTVESYDLLSDLAKATCLLRFQKIMPNLTENSLRPQTVALLS